MASWELKKTEPSLSKASFWKDPYWYTTILMFGRFFIKSQQPNRITELVKQRNSKNE